MNTLLKAPITIAQIIDLVSSHRSGTHFRILKAGGKRATCITVNSVNVDKFDCSALASIEIGTREPGLAFESLMGSGRPKAWGDDPLAFEMKQREHGEKARADEGADKPRGPVGPPRKLVPGMTARMEQISELQRSRSQVKNYTAYMDSLLLDLQTEDGELVEVEGYLRSKFTVPQALKLVLKRYPKKNPASVKRILKVRPRHLEKMKTLGAFDDAKSVTRAPRWAWVGPGSGVDFVNRIRKLLLESQRTAEKAAEIACREFGRELTDGIRIARNTLKHIRHANGTAGPSAQDRKKIKAGKVAALKAKNQKHRAESLAAR